jgi:hypothetical protein
LHLTQIGHGGEVLAPDLEQIESAPTVFGPQGGRGEFSPREFLASLLQRQEGVGLDHAASSCSARLSRMLAT